MALLGGSKGRGGGRSRRELAVPLLGLALLAALGGIALSETRRDRAGDRPPPPNVLLVISDDQRDGTLDVMPQTRRHIAARGRAFRRAMVTTPLCCPSRVSILGGRYAHNHGVRVNPDAPEVDESQTIAAELREAGYFNGLYGKYLNNWPEDRPPANFHEHVVGYGPAGGFSGKERGRERADDWLGERSREFIEARESDERRPWFLVLSARSPHNPLKPAARYKNAKVPKAKFSAAFNESDLSDKPAAVRKAAKATRESFAKRGGFRKVVENIRKRQLRLLLSLDDMVGKTMQTLERTGEAENTLVIYVSDNGFFWGEHGFTQKGRAYPETLEVPLLVRWPGRIEPGTSDHRIAANIDIAPTIYEAAGVKPRYELDGHSLLGERVREWGLVEKWITDGSIRGTFAPGSEQYLENRTDGGRLKSREYYDLSRDQHGLENLIGTPQEPRSRVRELSRALAEAAGCAGAACP